MAHSLLAHLYSHIKGSQEDIATLSLQYLLSQSAALNEAFTSYVASILEINLGEKLKYSCQSVGENNERPDMAGANNEGKEVLLCEMKFTQHSLPINQLAISTDCRRTMETG